LKASRLGFCVYQQRHRCDLNYRLEFDWFILRFSSPIFQHLFSASFNNMFVQSWFTLNKGSGTQGRRRRDASVYTVVIRALVNLIVFCTFHSTMRLMRFALIHPPDVSQKNAVNESESSRSLRKWLIQLHKEQRTKQTSKVSIHFNPVSRTRIDNACVLIRAN
jgi:hypothetical protein